MQAVTDSTLVHDAAAAYYEAWFDGDAERMADALHPNLVKRMAGEELGITTRERMVELTRGGEGTKEADDRSLDVQVLDVHGDIASARVRSAVYYEYLHFVRTPAGWKIANALFEVL